MFEYEGQEVTLAQIEEAAKASGMSVDDYKAEVGIKELGKTSPTPQQGAETVDVTQAPDTGLQPEDGSLESLRKSARKQTRQRELDARQPKQQDDDNNGRLGFLGSLATSFNLIPANIQKQEIGVRDLILLTADKFINPELSRQERFDKLNRYFNDDDDPIAGYPGLGIIRTADTKEEAVDVIKELRNKQMKTEQQSLSKALEQGNIKDAAF